MPSIVSIAAFAGLASLTVASPVANMQKRAGGFRVNQVAVPRTAKRNGAAAMQKALLKYGKEVPTKISAAAASVSGTVEATPEEDDSEYLCPVDVGGTTLNLDFDTGSADLYATFVMTNVT